jgi:hypothetical protein
MNASLLTKIAIASVLVSLCFCGSLPALIKNAAAPTSTPDADATTNAIVTAIGAGPLMQGMSTLNAMGTTMAGPANSATYDGLWKGDGVTIDGTDLTIQLTVSGNVITDIAIGYKGTGNVSCEIRGSSKEGVSKVSFLPAPITNNSVTITEWGIDGVFFPNNAASGSISTTVTGQSQKGCNIEIKAAWQAAK